jgi:hypothetical protein
VLLQPAELGGAAPPEVGPQDPLRQPRLLDQDRHRRPLPDVREDVAVLRAVRRPLLLLAVAVEVEQVDLVEGLEERMAHPTEGRIVEVTVIGHQRHDPLPGLLDLRLGEAEEFQVVVLQPLGALLLERLAVDVAVAVEPRPPVGRVAGPRGVAEDDGDPRLLLDPPRQQGLPRERRHARERRLLQVLRLQSVGEIEGDPLAVAQGAPQLLQDQAHLEMADGVRGHHQLEGVEVAQQVLAHQSRHHAAAGRAPRLLHGATDRLDHEGEGPRRRIEEGGPGIREAVPPAQARLEQPVRGAHDIGDQLRRRVVDPAPPAQPGVVVAEEGLVEVEHRIAPTVDGPLQHLVDRGVGEQVDDLVDDPGDLPGGIGQGDVAEGVAQQAAGGRDALRRDPPVEEAAGPPAGGEQAVGQGLGVEVGELSGIEPGHQVLREGLVEAREVRAPLGVRLQQLAQPHGQQAGAQRQAEGQLGGRGGRGRREIAEEVEERLHVRATDLGAGRHLRSPVEPELAEVGEQEIGERLAVAPELVGVLRPRQVGPRGLRLDVAGDPLPPAHLEVEQAALHLPGEDQHLQIPPPPALRVLFQETGEERIKALLPRLPPPLQPGDPLQVLLKEVRPSRGGVRNRGWRGRHSRIVAQVSYIAARSTPLQGRTSF